MASDNKWSAEGHLGGAGADSLEPNSSRSKERDSRRRWFGLWGAGDESGSSRVEFGSTWLGDSRLNLEYKLQTLQKTTKT